MKLFSFLTNPVFWRAYKRNLIAGVALLLIALFGFNVFIGNNPLKRGPVGANAQEYTESAGCDGTHAVWGKWNGSQLIEVEADYGETGECGYSSNSSAKSSASSSSSSSSSTSSSNSGSWSFVYPECDWSTNKVYDVYWHSGTGEYDRKNYHYQDGACGYSKSSGQVQGAQTTQSGEWRFVYPECDWSSKQVYDVYWHSGTGQYDRRNPHYQEDACGYNKEWEGAGCNSNHSVWGVWSKQGGSLLRVERDYGVVPGECNNPVSTPTPVQTQVPQRTYQDRQECDGRRLIVRRYWSDNRNDIVTNYGEYAGYCGVQTYTNTPVYTAPTQTTAIYQPAQQQPVYQQPATAIPQIQAACTSNTTQIFRGGSATYSAYISTGGSGRLGRVEFRGEQSQTSGNGSFTVQYNTSGAKLMMATVYDADARGGSQVVQCPTISVTEPTTTAATTVLAPTYAQQPLPQPVQQQPVYQQQQTTYVYPAPAPTVSQPTNYCPAGGQQLQVISNVVYCQVNSQIIAYTFSGTGVINQQVVTSVPNANAPITQNQGSQQVIVNPSVTAPTPSGTTIQCPAGYVAQAFGTNVYCVQSTGQQKTSVVTTANQTQGNVVLATATSSATEPKVLTTAATDASVTELPKTGLPLAAWGISALLPLGLKMRKNKKSDQESSVNSIWMVRQLNKD